MTTFEKVRQTIRLETGELVTPDTRLVTLVTDSLEMASLVTELENAFGFDIPDEDMQKLFTVKDVVDYVEQHDKESHSVGHTADR
jgi:acyl carrier protein